MGKKFFLKTLVTAVALSAVGFVLSSAAIAQTAAPLEIKVGIYDNKPKLWTDEQGKAQGIFPDILNEIARRENWNIVYVPGTWDEGLARLSNKEIDIMPDVAFSDERQVSYDFNSETVLVNWGNIYSKKGIRVESMADLAGKSIATLENGIHYNGPLGLKNMLTTFNIEAKIVFVREYNEVFELLDQGAVDVGIVNRIYGYSNEQNYGVMRTNIFLNPTELRFAFQKGSATGDYYISRIDDQLREMKNDNSSPYHQAMITHLGGLVERIEVFPMWAKYIGIAVVFLLFASGVYVLVLWALRKRLKAMLEKQSANLIASENKYRSIFETSDDAILVFTFADRVLVDCNPSALTTFRYSNREEMFRKKLGEFSPRFQPDGRESMIHSWEKFNEALENGRSFFEWTLVRKDNEEFPAEITVMPMTYDDKTALHITIRDVTKRKEYDRRAKQLDELKSRFVQTISHQMRTPLTSIRWCLEGLASSKFGKPAPEQKALLKTATEANLELIFMVGDIVDALEIEEGRMILEKKPIAFEQLFTVSMASLDGLRNDKEIRLINNFPESQKTLVNADVKRISDAILRLANNAIQYTKPGGTISVRIKPNGKSLRFEITDNGIGVPKEDQQRIFERFVRGSNVGDSKDGGSGLGLYLAKEIINAHGGKIGMESEVDKGSTFWFDLPLAEHIS